MRKLTLLPVLLLFACLAVAQTSQVSGKITDQTGQPIPNASVLIKGTHTGTTSEADGSFKLTVKKGDALVISAVMYKTFEIKTGTQTSFDIKLAFGTNLMDEVIVTAGGIKSKRKEIGNATTSIKGEDVTAGKAVNIAAGLQGKVAGFQISGTSSGVNPNYRLVLRGQRSLTGNNQALVVLDNVIVPNSVLGNLNPEDVEEVTILNGAGAAALYGSQASNGAVVVTTKKGKKGSTMVRLSNTTTVEQVAFFPKLQKKFGAGGTAYGLDINGNPYFNYLENQSYGSAFDGSYRPLGPALEDGSQDSAYYSFNEGHNKFWVKGITNQTDVSLSSGDDVSTFYLSGQYAKVTGTTPGDKYNRTTLRINGTRKVGSAILVSYTAAYTQNRYDITTQTAAMYDNMLNMPGNADVTKYKDWRNNKFANPNGFYNPWYQNPYFTADNNRSLQRNDYLIGSAEIRYTPVRGLDITARQGVSTRNYSNKNTVGAFTYTTFAKNTDQSSKSDIAATVSDGSNYTTELITDVFAQYKTSVNDFSFTLLAGVQNRQDEAKYVGVGASGLVIPNLYNVSNGVGTPSVGESDYKARQLGAYGDLRIGYKNYLFLHGTGRNDWVSILDPENRSFFYPAVDMSFVASEAIAPIKDSRTISYLKIRGGWSKVGQVNLGNSSDFGAYYLLPTYGTASGFPYGSLAGYTVGNTLVAKGLKPELTKGYEVGFDLNLFRDRVTTNITWFNTKTDNQTVNTSVSSSTGFTGLRTNAGQTESRGIEATIGVNVFRTKDWSVNINANYSWLDNKVNFISALLPSLTLSSSGSANSVAMPGMAFPVITGYDYVRDNAGHVIVNAVTGLPTKTSTVVVLGNATAKNRIGLSPSVSYKSLHFTALLEYRGGYKVFNGIGTGLDWSGMGYRTAVYNRQSFVFPNSVYEDPSKPGTYLTNTSILIANGNGNNGFWTDDINRGVSSNYVTSGEFWKLREVAVSYDLPRSLLDKRGIIKGATISVQARNLFMWLAKDNLYTDPEYSDAGNDSNGIGLNSESQTPPSRFYGATISIKF